MKHNKLTGFLSAMLFASAMCLPITAYAAAEPGTPNIPTPRITSPSVISGAPINLRAQTQPAARPTQTNQQQAPAVTAPRARAQNPNTASAHNARLEKERTQVNRKIASPFPENFAGGYVSVTPEQAAQTLANTPERKQKTPARAATSSLDPEAPQSASPNFINTPRSPAAKSAPIVSPTGVTYNSATNLRIQNYNGLSRR